MTRGRMREPSPAAPPPCADAPERWFDSTDRTQALRSCLGCPVRQWCAREALSSRATWGMWAGIWIDHRPDDVEHLLRAIAAGDQQPEADRPERCSAPSPLDDMERREFVPLSVRPVRSRSVTTAVLARSSGHCEVVSAGCRFTADLQLSRVPDIPVAEAASPSMAYAACHPCADLLGSADGRTAAHRRGFLVDSPTRAAGTPLLWRGVRWVLLGGSGEVLDRIHHESVRAS
jgi:hypothetical protein